MPTSVWSQEWLNANSQRAWPLSEDASGFDETESFKLPRSFLVDLYFPVSSALLLRPGRFLIHTISSYTVGFGVVIGYDDGAGVTPVASALIPRDSHTPNSVYTLGGLGDFADGVGFLVVGILDDMDAQPAGEFSFDLDGGKLELECIRPQLRDVSSLAVQNGAVVSDPIYGDVYLTAGTNTRLTTILEDDDVGIRLDFIEGEGSVEACTCDGEAVGPPIRSINDVFPNAAGELELRAGDCTRITPGDHELVLEDLCSSPCCGCSELAPILEDLQKLGDRVRTMETFVARLEAANAQMDQVILGSRLNDTTCTP